MGRRIILRKYDHGIVWVDSDIIPVLLSIDDADVGKLKPIEECKKDPANIPPDTAGKRAKLKKMDWLDEDLDVLEREGLI